MQLGYIGDGIGQVKFLVRNLIGYQFTKPVTLREGEFLHTGHILDSHLRGHGTVGDDMGHLLQTVLLRHPTEYLTAAIVIEIDVDIRQ